jgi:hypothetical protein
MKRASIVLRFILKPILYKILKEYGKQSKYRLLVCWGTHKS